MHKNVIITKTEILSDNWYILRKLTYDFQDVDGAIKTQTREVYDRGNGATVLLYNTSQKTVILTNQFRLPTFVNGNETGMLIEACAGLLDKDNPEDCIRRETEEETGYKITDVKKIFEAYIAEYEKSMKVHDGGGLEHEEENIEVLELDIDQAVQMIASGEIKDGKTIMLLQYVKLNGIL
jgi:nudix-type nucleoside diphosphatase (YffH/AdpP family)